MSYKILVVDDKPENIKVLMEVLRDHYSVIAATNGTKALELARKEPVPDMILLDVMMPDMDGYDVCRQLKADPLTNHIPVIFVTTINEATGEEIGLSAGAIDYLNKPVVPGIVLARVKNHLELKAYRDDLEQRVKEETEKRMEQQNLLVRHARLAAMGEMMSAITHQWSQPLNVIAMNAEMISMLADDKKAADEIRKNSESIRKNVRFMSETAEDFKNYFKPEKRKSCFTIKPEVEAVCDMLSSQIKHAGVRIEIRNDLSVCGYGVPSEFKQVILNLISNALDAIKAKRGPAGPGEIIFDSYNDEGITVIKVMDDGGGISDEVIAHVFDDHFTTKGDSGTGIGLSMSKMIVEEGMGGSMHVENTDKGACFTLKFPSEKSERL